MSHIIAHERINDVTTEIRKPSDRFASWIEEMTRQINLNTPILGTGSPEGVVIGEPGQFYINTAGVAGSVIYAKKTGSGSTGWSL